jgi:hypothetical protein
LTSVSYPRSPHLSVRQHVSRILVTGTVSPFTPTAVSFSSSTVTGAVGLTSVSDLSDLGKLVSETLVA